MLLTAGPSGVWARGTSDNESVDYSVLRLSDTAKALSAFYGLGIEVRTGGGADSVVGSPYADTVKLTNPGILVLDAKGQGGLGLNTGNNTVYRKVDQLEIYFKKSDLSDATIQLLKNGGGLKYVPVEDGYVEIRSDTDATLMPGLQNGGLIAKIRDVERIVIQLWTDANGTNIEDQGDSLERLLEVNSATWMSYGTYQTNRSNTQVTLPYVALRDTAWNTALIDVDRMVADLEASASAFKLNNGPIGNSLLVGARDTYRGSLRTDVVTVASSDVAFIDGGRGLTVGADGKVQVTEKGGVSLPYAEFSPSGDWMSQPYDMVRFVVNSTTEIANYRVIELKDGGAGSSSDADLQAIQQGYEFKVTLSGATKAYLKNIEAVQFRQASGDGTLLTQWFLRDPVLGVASNGVHAMALTGSAFDNDFDANAQMQMWVTTSNFYKSYAFGGQAPSGSVVDSITGIPLPSTLLPWEPAFSASATASNGAYLRGAGGNDIMRGTNYQDAFVVNTAGSNWIDGRGHEGYRTAQNSPATPTDDTILAARDEVKVAFTVANSVALFNPASTAAEVLGSRLLVFSVSPQTQGSVGASLSELSKSDGVTKLLAGNNLVDQALGSASPRKVAGLEASIAAQALLLNERSPSLSAEYVMVKLASDGKTVSGVDFLTNVEAIQVLGWSDWVRDGLVDEQSSPNAETVTSLYLNLSSLSVDLPTGSAANVSVQPLFGVSGTGLATDANARIYFPGMAGIREGSVGNDLVDLSKANVTAGGYLVATSQGSDTVMGSSGNDVFMASAGDDVFDGGAGQDVVAVEIDGYYPDATFAVVDVKNDAGKVIRRDVVMQPVPGAASDQAYVLLQVLYEGDKVYLQQPANGIEVSSDGTRSIGRDQLTGIETIRLINRMNQDWVDLSLTGSLSGIVSIQGSAFLGQTLTAVPAVTHAGSGSLAYQWYADGVLVPNATSSSLKLEAASNLAAKVISVKVSSNTGELMSRQTSAVLAQAGSTLDREANLFDRSSITNSFSANGLAGSDTLIGGSADDSLLGAYGGSGAPWAGDRGDSISGGAGNDVLRGNAGNDTLLGGEGRDNLRGDLGNDYIDGGLGNLDIVSYRFDEPLALPHQERNRGKVFALPQEVPQGSAVQIPDGLGGVDTVLNVEQFLVSGTAYGDRFTGGPLVDQLNGNAGSDTLLGMGGDDSLFGGEGDDSLEGGDGNDLVVGDLGDDVLVAGPGKDTVSGDSGVDQIDLSDGSVAATDLLLVAGAFVDRDVVKGFQVSAINGDILAFDGARANGVFQPGPTPVPQELGVPFVLPVALASVGEVARPVVGPITGSVGVYVYLIAANILTPSSDGTELLKAIGGTVTAANAEDVLYFIVDDGKDSYVYRGSASAKTKDNAITADEFELVATLTGIADATTLTGQIGFLEPPSP
jgi:Ca2+-binding RTX toxin-like protein